MNRRRSRRRPRRDEYDNDDDEYRIISLPSHLLWRSVLGNPAAWSGTSSRGVYLPDDIDEYDRDEYCDYCDDDHCDDDFRDDDRRPRGRENDVDDDAVAVRDRPIFRRIATDARRMRRLRCSLVDRVVGGHLLGGDCDDDVGGGGGGGGGGGSDGRMTRRTTLFSTMRLLSHPRIVGPAARSSPSSSSSSFSRSTTTSSSSSRPGAGWTTTATARSGATATTNGDGSLGIGGGPPAGISCMDVDRGPIGGGGGACGSSSPPRYLLVGSAGRDCSVALYDMSHFGSDAHLHQSASASASASVHRPVARSVRRAATTGGASGGDDDLASGVPSGHRHPVLGVHWYPADVCGSFVSASMSGEVLVWDARNFVPVFATFNRVHSSAIATIAGGGGGAVGVGAPVRCTDVPKTPGGCPHGSALLALGLGDCGGVGGGGGVVRLCDAFRGGDATHELTTKVGGMGGGGGVNAVAWDPCHPFRLASGDDGGAVRLWDIRKSGSAACLGVLDREEDGMPRGDDHRKRRGGGAISHSGPVTAVTFAPDGDDLVSSGSDGTIRHWDLRPDSCFVSSMAAIGESGRGRRRFEEEGGGGGGGGGDPSVAMGGRLLPTHFAAEERGRSGELPAGVVIPGRPPPPRRRRHRHHLAIIQPGSRTTATLISTANDGTNSSRGQITGYSLFGGRGKEPGGSPSFVLSGHLADVSCLVPIVGTWDSMAVGRRRCTATTNQVNFLTGGMDGMVLSWGGSHNRRINASEDENDGEANYYRRHDKSTRRGYRGYVGIHHQSPSTHEENTSFVDVDTW